jgi:hypothetical protein
MRTLESRNRQRHDGQVSCVACASHMHPEMVPWLQHSIGCPVRTAALVVHSGITHPHAARSLAASAATR